MANVLVTGGGGFIGSHLVTRFVELGHHVRVLDDFSSGKHENLASVRDKIAIVEGDMCDRDVCRAACDGVEYVFHEAAIPSVPKSIDLPRESHNANINGTFELLMAAAECKVRRLIYAASSSAYGDAEVSPKHEGLVPMPLSPYAAQKLAGETYAQAFASSFGLETISLRYFNVFGMRQDPTSTYAAAIPAFVTAILRGEQPIVYGDGEQTRDFTYIDNVVHGNLLAMQVRQARGEVVNVASGGRFSVNWVIGEINRLLGTTVIPKYLAPRAGDVRHSCADITRAKELLGYEVVVSFADGLQRTIDYYRSLT